jgi:hypothetical protein
MREIMFRAWDKSNSHFIYVILIHGKLGLPKYAKWNGLGDWLQYTGLKDKNGVEIWEGDVVRETWEDFKPQTAIFPVTFDEDIGRFVVYNAYKSLVEVVGNIYENPELLNQAA